MRKGLFVFSMSLLCALMLMGCSTAGAESEEAPGTEQTEAAQATIADAFGGGEENWTSDQSTYIGRIYETELYGESVTVYAVCGAEKTVDAVSIWITDGKQEVSDEQVQTWQDRVTELTGAEMQDQGIAEESGSQSWKWSAGDTFYTLRLLDNILTLDINPAVGELH